MNTELQLKFNNNYHIELIDSSTGKVKQSGDFHNLTTDRLGMYFIGAIEVNNSNTARGNARIPAQIRVGSGTTEPAATNTNLSNTLWTGDASIQSFEWISDYSARSTAVVTFPASSDYVGTVREVGLMGAFWYHNNISNKSGWDYPKLVTRSLLTDSEGQVISFDKTDLDILKVTVTVELAISSLNENFELFKKSKLLHSMLAGKYEYTANYDGMYGELNLCRFHNTVESYQSVRSNGDYYITNLDLDVNTTPTAYYASGAREGYVQYPVTRVGTGTITSERYYKAIVIAGIGYWKLPNENIFPAYDIVDIPIGTGDGTTKSFENPLCYFKKDTEKIYKNGVQLTRDTDYTINHQSNKKCLPEITEYNVPDVITSAATSSTTLNGWVPLLIPTTANYIRSGTRFLSSANPLYIEYDEAVTLNCLKSNGGWKSPSGTNGYNNLQTGTVFYLDASDDGTTYEQVASVATTSSTADFNVDFENRTAKYWRLRTSANGSIGIMNQYSGDNYYVTLNFKDPYIVFTEAPADGDVLTMDVAMDIIMKNSNFVIDIGARLDFTW